MQIKIADVPVMIRCKYPENVDFFRDYWTDAQELFAIEPKPADLEQTQKDFERMDEADGLPKYRRPKEFLENTAIHALLAEKLIAYDVLLMHGSALCMDGQAYIFTAKSGTGKSTHAKLWRETFGERVWMVNDDKPMLQIGRDRVTVYGTPWNGKHELGRNASAPLKAIVSLERSEGNHIAPISRTDAFPLLMRQCFSSKAPAMMLRIVELEKRLLHAVDFYTMGCNMESKAARVAWKGLNAPPAGEWKNEKNY